MFGTGWRLEWNLRPGKTMDHIKYLLGPLDIWLRPTWIPYVDVAGKSVLEVQYLSLALTGSLSVVEVCAAMQKTVYFHAVLLTVTALPLYP